MPRGVPLETLVQQVRAEIGDSLDPAQGRSSNDIIVQRLARVQRRLYAEFDWPFLISSADKLTSPGQRYYDFPTGFMAETLLRIETRASATADWARLDKGISAVDRSCLDPEQNVRSDPARRWDIYGASQVEIWPLPGTAGLPLRFWCKAALPALAQTGDLCTLDSDLLVLYTAAELLSRRKSKDADVVLATANKHFLTLKSRLSRAPAGFSFTPGVRPGQRVQPYTRPRN